jgi:hypothetical protein
MVSQLCLLYVKKEEEKRCYKRVFQRTVDWRENAFRALEQSNEFDCRFEHNNRKDLFFRGPRRVFRKPTSGIILLNVIHTEHVLKISDPPKKCT